LVIEHTTGTNTTISKSFLPGVYFVTVAKPETKITKKVIIN